MCVRVIILKDEHIEGSVWLFTPTKLDGRSSLLNYLQFFKNALHSYVGIAMLGGFIYFIYPCHKISGVTMSGRGVIRFL